MGFYERLRHVATPELKEALDACEIIRIQQVMEYYNNDISTKDQFNNLLYRMIPPFSPLWMEYVTPDKISIEGSWIDRPWYYPKRVGYLLFTEKKEKGWHIYGNIFLDTDYVVLVETNLSSIIPSSVMFYTTEEGLLDVVDHEGIQYVLHRDVEGSEAEEFIKSALCAPIDLLALSLTFLNVKNVVLDTIEPKAKQDRKTKKFKNPEHKFKIIRITPLKPHVNYTPSKEEIARGRAWHKVRGTFRTYTEEHKLFGKWVGTFWFMPHERGKKEEGEIQHEYEVDLNA